MKSKVKILLIIFVLSALTGCGNRTLLDTTYTYDRAIIQLADGTVVDTKIKSWTDYEGGTDPSNSRKWNSISYQFC